MIRMNDFNAEPAKLRQQELAAVKSVLNSGRYILGNEVQKFENEWANYCGAKFAVGVASGMDAIEISLRALGIGPGDEVITTPMTAIATVLAIVRAGATPVLADIVPETALLDLASVECCLTKKTRAILLVHLYGQVLRMEAWKKFCDQKKILLIEDCAQSHGARWNGKMAGTFGAAGAYSFYPTKNLGARGDAGALITDSADVAARARALRNYGQTGPYRHSEFGLNSRLDELQAAILRVRLAWLEKFNARRKEIAAKYLKRVTNPKIKMLAAPLQRDGHVYHLFVVRCAERNRLAAFLKNRGIETLVHYPMAAHEQDIGRAWKRKNQKLHAAEQFAAECLSIPCHPQLRATDISHVVTALEEFV